MRPHLADKNLPPAGQLVLGFVAGWLLVSIVGAMFENKPKLKIEWQDGARGNTKRGKLLARGDAKLISKARRSEVGAEMMRVQELLAGLGWQLRHVGGRCLLMLKA